MSEQVKIIDLIKAKDPESKPFVSIEYFPPRTEDGVKVRREQWMDIGDSFFRRIHLTQFSHFI
jgi:hypothetical protein